LGTSKGVTKILCRSKKSNGSTLEATAVAAMILMMTIQPSPIPVTEELEILLQTGILQTTTHRKSRFGCLRLLQIFL
jgi:hypothetical protein